MKLVWLQDFLAVAETGSLSRAATLRHSSQPALSRRIQALEQWLQVELFNRGTTPVSLTPVAQRFIPQFQAMVSDIEQMRIRMQAEHRGAVRLTLATQHSLTITRLPGFLDRLTQAKSPRIDLNIVSEDHGECLAAFIRGDADLLMCMEDDEAPLNLRMPGMLRADLGHEVFIPVCASGAQGKPLHSLEPGKVFQMLAYTPASFVGRALYSKGLDKVFRDYTVQVVSESTFLAGIKEMVIAGLGAAWLPQNMVHRELDSGQLVTLCGDAESIAVPVALYGNPDTPYAELFQRVWQALGLPPAHAQ